MSSILHIGERFHEFISIEVTNRLYPETICFWDTNWIDTNIKFQFGDFQGSFSAQIRTEEILQFEKEINVLYNTPESEAHFETMEEQISLLLKGNNKGQIEFSGTLEDKKRNRLHFESALDQSYLPNLIIQLRKMREQFPVLHEDKK